MTKKEPGIINCDLRETIFKIQSDIEAIEKNTTLYEERNFDERIEIIDFIAFHIIDQIEALLLKTTQLDQLLLLKYRAEKGRAELEEIDINLFQKLQENIRIKGYTGKEFKDLINEYIVLNLEDNEQQEEPGYDNLDLFINGLFPFQAMPEQTEDLEPEMVYYQKTPARIIFELVERAHFKKEDVFVDLGSGLGQAAILVNLLAGIKTIGVEFEPAFCDYARACAAELNLSDAAFINVDARKADYSEGTVFFMFTPFMGEILQNVLEMLKKESRRRKIKIITYGPCTAQVALQNWLISTATATGNVYKLCFFTS